LQFKNSDPNLKPGQDAREQEEFAQFIVHAKKPRWKEDGGFLR